MKKLLLFGLLFTTFSVSAQFKSMHDFFRYLNYADTGSYRVQVIRKFKAAIAESYSNDTSVYNIQHTGGQHVVMLKERWGTWYLRDYLYAIYPDSAQYYYVQTKENHVKERLDFLPHFSLTQLNRKYANFWLNKNIYEEPGLIRFTKKDQVLTFLYDTVSRRITKYFDVIDAEEYGTQYQEYTFNEMPPLPGRNFAAELDEYISLYRNNASDPVKETTLNQFNITELKKLLGIDTANHSYIFLDFFYQSCLPCVQTIPYANQLDAIKEKHNLAVIGVDPNLQDTVFDGFVKRYNITYPIVNGKNARAIAQMMFSNNLGYPKEILMDGAGNIIEYLPGFYEARLKTLVKQFGADIPPAPAAVIPARQNAMK